MHEQDTLIKKLLFKETGSQQSPLTNNLFVNSYFLFHQRLPSGHDSFIYQFAASSGFLELFIFMGEAGKIKRNAAGNAHGAVGMRSAFDWLHVPGSQVLICLRRTCFRNVVLAAPLGPPASGATIVL